MKSLFFPIFHDHWIFKMLAKDYLTKYKIRLLLIDQRKILFLNRKLINQSISINFAKRPMFI